MKNQTKNQKANSSTNVNATEKVDALTKNVIVESFKVKKFQNVDYTLSAKEQKKQREKNRKGLFAIILSYDMLKIKKELTDESAKTSFETFKKYIKDVYNVPLTNVEDVFRGQTDNGRKQMFNAFITDFKAYLNKANRPTETKKDNKAKASAK